MPSNTFTYPVTEHVNQQLTAMVNRMRSPHKMVELLKREAFDYRSTSPAEVLSCLLDNGETVNLFCKYAGNHTQYANGHRGGVEYELIVYRDILSRLPLTAPRYYGSFHNSEASTCLVIEYLANSQLLKDEHSPANFEKAASWIATIHKLYADVVPDRLKKYDNHYYYTWLNRVEKIAESIKWKYPWLPSICTRFKDNMHLLAGHPTFIHGEYYTKNILVDNGTIYPVDWESAAIGPGEIDLACLMEGWDPVRKKAALESYIKTRWQGYSFPGEQFEKRLLLAKIYLFLRWTGEYEDPGVWINRSRWFESFYDSVSEIH